MKWVGHVERMGEEKLAKRADAQKVEGKGRRGRPRMRWGTAVREILKEWEENGEQQQKIESETVDREKSEERKEDKEKMAVTMATSPLMTGTTKGEELGLKD